MSAPDTSRYEIADQLGAGGMGEVFRARDAVLERWVALKRLPPDVADDPQRKRRFLREARAASALNHPGIITIHDVVRLGEVDYIVMELVEGRSLAERIPSGGLAVREALGWGLQIASALAVAHAAGIIHRDLKPGNVMVSDDDHVKVLDFGLAKRTSSAELPAEALAGTADATRTVAAPLTRLGAVLGTVDYMSPEQALGQPADARSDVFSFGTLLYEMLAGARPFRGDSAVSILHAVAYEEPVPIERLRLDLPPALAAVVSKALEKKPNRRYPSMGEVASVLETLTLAESAASRVASAPSRPPREDSHAGPPARGSWRRWGAVGAAVAVAGLLAASPAVRTLASSWFGFQPPPAPAVAVDPLAAVEPYELYRQGLGLLERWERKENILEAIRRFQLAIGKDASNAAAYAALGRAYWRRYRVEKDRAWLRQALSTSIHALGLAPQLTAARVSVGLARLDLGEREAAREDFESALALDPANADAWRGLAELAESEGETARAEELYGKALAARPDDWELHALVGYARYSAGRYQEAEASFRDSVELTPDNHSPRQSLAAALHMQGRYAEAATELQEALAIRPDPGVYSNLGTLYFYQGLYAQAAEALEKSVELGPNSYVRWANLGDAYRALPGAGEKSREAYLRAIQLLKQQLEAAPEDAALRSRFALYLARRGDAAEALAELDRPGSSDTGDAGTLFRRALAFEISGARERALSALEATLEAGYSLTEIRNEPDLAELRNDARYHRMVIRFESEDGTKG